MIALVFLLLILFLAAGTGRSLLRLLRLTPEPRIDRLVYSTALGLGVIAYLVLLLGLLGLLSRGPVLTALLLLAALAGGGSQALKRSGAQGTEEPEHLNTRTPERLNTSSPLPLLTGVVLTAIGLLTLLNCFVPPGAREWDALSYHLANPKVFLREGRIVFLPTDHHSNFPFLMQMLFLVGLLFDGYALANLFHFATGALCVAAVLSIGRRHFAPSAGLIGALVVATTPLVIWESSTAYVDMAFALYVLLAVAAALEFRERRDSRWLALSGVLMGFALSVKTLALIPFTLLALLLLVEHRRVRTAGLYLLCAIVVGCPFYLKTWILTGNPVYPFAYRIFGGRYWNARLAEIYASEQRGFGINRELIRAEDDLHHIRPPYYPPQPFERVRNLIVAPFYLVVFPRLFYNFNDLGFASQLGFLFLALPPLLFLAGGGSGAARWLGALALLWLAAWSQTMQYVRYLLPLLPLFALLGGEGAWRMAARFPPFSGLIGAAVALQLGLTLSFFLPELPQQCARAFNPTVREEYLAASVNHYSAMQWLNRRTPPDAGVVLFEETRGFHLDRPYLWGNGPHSTYIPYDTFTTGRQMADWFLQHGYRYAILNLQFAQQSQSSEGYARLKAASQEGTMAKLMLEWYDPKTLRDEHWRWLLADAIWNGGAVYVPEASSRGAVVLEFRPGRSARSAPSDNLLVKTR